MDNGEKCTNLNVSSSTKLTCDVPKITDNTKQGIYPVIVNTQAAADVKSDNGFAYYAKSVCENGNSNNDCQVDIDANIIPVKYDSGKWVKADVNAAGDWYDYGNKKWANAVTVTSDKVDTYKSAAAGIEIPNDDVLGYWVYIPRYAYEVMRPDATDRVVPEQNFSIKFETADSAKYTKKSPATSCNANIKTANDMWNNGTSISSAQYDNSGILAKDYRTECGISRNYYTGDDSKANSTTWATHPAFTFGNKELNDTYHASLLRNDQWGATAYLSASSFGAGVNKVKNNGAYISQGTDADGNSGKYGGITGCGPSTTSDTPESANDNYYTNKGTALSTTTTESSTACNSNTGYAYNGSIGQLASTTNNIYGVYDMAGGVGEFVAGSYTTTNDSSTNGITTAISEPYVNLYKSSDGFSQGTVAWQDQSGEGTKGYLYNFQICKWSNCGAQDLHETRSVQSVTAWNDGWGSDSSYFVYASTPWLVRGGITSFGSRADIFAAYGYSGGGWAGYGSRAALSN